ncbi:type IV pilus assembly protein PilM [Cryobacterium sp. TMT1-3]|uniref:Type IV pilus assembly protein PilM n=1 Tax=Cryobacterium luteum TaxID=1424661 RepID=A0A1H8BZC8_9MICO|nr:MULTISPECIES: type IV pilus assembly protein PilM [Cryobacterium]TFB89187.1 type IV pilus assembly protein PilM [Cryobacterium luteum]TFC31796.1 type IV pilus assembly protein PilM [Cryobacterium sp. TMT1-3]SEM88146.1 type IV pilus assembly protein PilM [Cryobacterium luteum]
MTRHVVGIDIGRASLRAVELADASREQPTIVRFHEEALPDGAVGRGEVLEPNTVASQLKRLWAGGKFTSKNVVIGMGNHRVVARDLTVPAQPMRSIREALPFQVQDLLSVPVSEALLDFYPIKAMPGDGQSGPQLNGLLIAAVKDVVLRNVRAVQLAGLNPVAVDLIPFALSRAIRRGGPTDDVVAQIDVGAGTTSVVITAAGVPQFVRLIPAGGDDLTQALTAHLDLPADQAEALKRASGIGLGGPLTASTVDAGGSVDTAADGAAATAALVIHEGVSELLASLRNTVNYFIHTRSDLPVTRIVLTGGGARLGGFAAQLADLTRLPVVPPNPTGGLAVGKGVDAERLVNSRGDYLVALGLALGRTA